MGKIVHALKTDRTGIRQIIATLLGETLNSETLEVVMVEFDNGSEAFAGFRQCVNQGGCGGRI